MTDVMGIVRKLYQNERPFGVLKTVTAAFLSKPIPVLTDEEVTELLGHLQAFVIAQVDLNAPIDVVSEAIMLIGLIGTPGAIRTLDSLEKQTSMKDGPYLYFIHNAQREIEERGGKILRLVNE